MPSLILLVEELFLLGAVGMGSVVIILLPMLAVLVDWHALLLLSNLASGSPLTPSFRLFRLLFCSIPLKLALGFLVPSVLCLGGLRRCG